MNAQSTSPKPAPWKVIIPVAIVVILCCLCLVVAGGLAYLGTQGTGPLSMLASATPTLTFTQTFTSTPTRTATRTATPTEIPTIVGAWDLYYDWNCDGGYRGPVVVTFLVNNTYYISENDDTAFGTWYLAGAYIDFIFDEYPNADYTGEVDPTYTYMEGTMSTADNSSGCWYATLK